jgi:hypothetical protein
MSDPSFRPDLEPEAVLAACTVVFTRRSGPGGQNRNKVETAAVLTHRPTGLVAEANERRSQAENRAAALHRLRLRLALEERIAWDPRNGPSPLWRSRCRGGRIAINPEHDDFPAVLAEALDAVVPSRGDLQAAAAALGCTASQLLKLLKLEPRALQLVNRIRLESGQHALR